MKSLALISFANDILAELLDMKGRCLLGASVQQVLKTGAALSVITALGVFMDLRSFYLGALGGKNAFLTDNT